MRDRQVRERKTDLSQLLCDVNSRLCVQCHSTGSNPRPSLCQRHEDDELRRKRRPEVGEDEAATRVCSLQTRVSRRPAAFSIETTGHDPSAHWRSDTNKSSYTSITTESVILDLWVSVMSAWCQCDVRKCAHLVLQELVHAAIVSYVSQQHLSSLNTDFICIHTWDTHTHIMTKTRWLPQWESVYFLLFVSLQTHKSINMLKIFNIIYNKYSKCNIGFSDVITPSHKLSLPFFPRAEPANTQPVDDSAIILKHRGHRPISLLHSWQQQWCQQVGGAYMMPLPLPQAFSFSCSAWMLMYRSLISFLMVRTAAADMSLASWKHKHTHTYTHTINTTHTPSIQHTHHQYNTHTINTTHTHTHTPSTKQWSVWHSHMMTSSVQTSQYFI